MRRKVLIFSGLLLTASLGFYCLKVHKSETPITEIPRADKVLVLKSERKLHLLRKGKVIKTYTISLGDDPIGHKQREGDERTPEGNYILDWRNSKSSCYKSIHISYPNEEDKKRAKKMKVSPGGDIMIHGLHPGIEWMGQLHCKKDWTDGCIAVTNEEMDEIWKSVKNGISIEIKK